MSHPAPSNADPIRLTAARLPREARNSLISSVLEPNLMPFGSDPNIRALRTAPLQQTHMISIEYDHMRSLLLAPW